MTVKDFNQHKSNGGIVTATIIDARSIPSSTGKATATEPTLRVPQVRHAVNAACLTH